MSDFLASIETAIADIAAGKMLILIDDMNRENEGDLVMAAEHVTPEAINFMIRYGRGLVCMPMLEKDFIRLRIPMMVEHNTAPRQTAFGVSIEAREGVTTGISAQDRATTIRVAANAHSMPGDIVMPGHVFPLCAKQDGILVRKGHTEGSVDLARLAGLRSAAVICEIINDDGTMARVPDLIVFAKLHNLCIVSIHDLQTYRITHEELVEFQAQTRLPVSQFGEFTLHVFTSCVGQKEIVALSKPCRDPNKPPLVRLHSACMTGDVFGSLRCDCGVQLATALEQLAHEGGYLIYLPQEGRGIGLANKIKAYALQDQGFDTVEANYELGFEADLRDYGLAAQVLRKLCVTTIRLITNNPRKATGLQRYGIDVVECVAIQTPVQEANRRYLQTKRKKLGHWLREDPGESSKNGECE